MELSSSAIGRPIAAQSLTTPAIALLSIRLIALTAYRLKVSAKFCYLEYLPSYLTHGHLLNTINPIHTESYLQFELRGVVSSLLTSSSSSRSLLHCSSRALAVLSVIEPQRKQQVREPP